MSNFLVSGNNTGTAYERLRSFFKKQRIFETQQMRMEKKSEEENWKTWSNNIYVRIAYIVNAKRWMQTQNCKKTCSASTMMDDACD